MDYEPTTYPKRALSKKKGLQKKTKIMLSILLAFLLAGSLGFVYKKQISLFLFDTFAAKDIKEKLDESYEAVGHEPDPEEEVSSTEPFSVLLLGVDPRGNERGRSDSMIVAVVRPKDNRLLLVSVPRDTYTEIIGYDTTTKINAAYSYGGAKMSIDTVEHLLQNNIHYYATINFNGLKDVVDAIGGVELPITSVIENKLASHEKLRIEPNKPIYDGKDALSYVRYREDSDENRTERQRIFLRAFMNELFKLKNVSKVPELIDIAGDNFTTNMKSDLILSLAKEFFMKDSLPTITNYMLHGEGFRTDAWYYAIDPEDLTYTQQLIANWLDADITAQELIRPDLRK